CLTIYRLTSEKRSRSIVSETRPMGGESIIIISNSLCRLSMKLFIFSLSNNSDGLGGTGPEGTTNKFSYSVARTNSSKLHLSTKKEDSPVLLETFIYSANYGFLRSIPKIHVFFPLRAIAEAILILTKVFPSPAMLEVTNIFLHFFSLAI